MMGILANIDFGNLGAKEIIGAIVIIGGIALLIKGMNTPSGGSNGSSSSSSSSSSDNSNQS